MAAEVGFCVVDVVCSNLYGVFEDVCFVCRVAKLEHVWFVAVICFSACQLGMCIILAI